MKKLFLLFPLLLILISGCFKGIPEYESAPPPEFRMHDKALLAGASIADDDVLMMEDLSASNATKHITFSGFKIYVDAGNVTSPSATDGDFARYDGATGLLLKDGIALEQTLSNPGDNSTVATTSAIRLALSDHNTEILNAAKTLVITDKRVHFFDCNGTDRDVNLPSEATSTDLVFTIVNASNGAGEDIVIKNDAPATLVTVGPEQGAEVSCDGTTWRVWFNNGIYYDGVGKGTQIYRVLAQTVTDANITLTSAHCGKAIHMSSASDYIAFLPSVGISDNGARIRICKTGAGKVTVDAADSDLINDSGAGDTVYNDVAAEIYAFIDLEYVHAIVTWIATGTGTWVTTD